MAPENAGVATIVAENPRALAEEASALILARIEAAIAARGRALVILAGGATPRPTYSLLSEAIVARAIPMERVSWFFGDERWVPRDHPQSNEGMARNALLGRISTPEASIHSWEAGAGNPVECARRYGEMVRARMGRPVDAADLLILGLGADGHTASLFPGSVAILPGGARVPVGPEMPGEAAAVEGDDARGWRLTLCPVFLGTSRCVVFLVAGSDKAPALRRAREGDASTPGAWIKGAATIYIATRDAMEPATTHYGKEMPP